MQGQEDFDVSSPVAVSLGNDSDEIRYTNLSGDRVPISQYYGKIIVVNSWASWSPTSAAELQSLNALSTEYDPDDIHFLAINRSEPSATAQAFLRAFGVGDTVTLLLDEDDYYYHSIGGFSMPETVVYDSQGAVLKHFRGSVPVSELRQIISGNIVDKN